MGERSYLSKRYTTSDEHLLSRRENSSTWLAWDEDDETYVLRTWSFDGAEKQYLLQRALWNRQLRLLSRIRGAPGADGVLLQLRDAGVDHKNKCFVMVLEAAGYSLLSSVISSRARHEWLDIRNRENRLEIWRFIRRLAEGLTLIHDQNILHRNLSSAAIYVDDQLGLPSARLGGFEWSIRIDHLGVQDGTNDSAAADLTFSQDTDWEAMSRVTFDVLFGRGDRSRRTKEEMLKVINATPTQRLLGAEKDFLYVLVAGEYDHGAPIEFVSKQVEEICDRLEFARQDSGDRQLYLVLDMRTVGRDIAEEMTSRGIQIDADDPLENFSERNAWHKAAVKDFVRMEFSDPEVYLDSGNGKVTLVGASLAFSLGAWDDKRKPDEPPSWRAAMVYGLTSLWNPDGALPAKIPLGSVDVTSTVDYRRNPPANFLPWDRYIPKPASSGTLDRSLTRLQDFLCCTNQLDLLLRTEEIFAYELVEVPETSGGFTKVVIRDGGESTEIPHFFNVNPELVEYFRQSFARGTERRAILLPEERHLLYKLPDHRNELDVLEWEIMDLSRGSSPGDSQTMTLVREGSIEPSRIPSRGLIKASGLAGQLRLIVRRQEAINRLDHHPFLLRSLISPDNVYIHLGADFINDLQIPDSSLDRSKQAVMKDLLSTRPIYSLQGPPGTGKSTLVEFIIQKIFEEDPVAQVLITAQAHDAIDGLRDKIDASFEDGKVLDRPISVRVGLKDGVSSSASVRETSCAILEDALTTIESQPQKSAMQQTWSDHLVEMLDQARAQEPASDAKGFFELVRRSANITYSTTSSGELARTEQSFEWSIVEEAGKSHGFDLALPLHLGQRWLLIGDQKQLTPFGFSQFEENLSRLETAIAEISDLPTFGAFSNRAWIDRWFAMDEAAKQLFIDFCRRWILTFSTLWAKCAEFTGEPNVTRDEPSGALSGYLQYQYRMHPIIGELVSHAFYDNELKHETVDSDGNPEDGVCHGSETPDQISGMALSWLDVPWCKSRPDCSEKGDKTGETGLPYTNYSEIHAINRFLESCMFPVEKDLAILSPYTQQVFLLEEKLADFDFVSHGLRVGRVYEDQPDRVAHTVDSFQGAEADVVIVSLVRNNTMPPDAALGFLSDPSRLNVLFSRAKCLLVLVGSLDFFTYCVEDVSAQDKNNKRYRLSRAIGFLNSALESGDATRVSADLSGFPDS